MRLRSNAARRPGFGGLPGLYGGESYAPQFLARFEQFDADVVASFARAVAAPHDAEYVGVLLLALEDLEGAAWLQGLRNAQERSIPVHHNCFRWRMHRLAILASAIDLDSHTDQDALTAPAFAWSGLSTYIHQQEILPVLKLDKANGKPTLPLALGQFGSV